MKSREYKVLVNYLRNGVSVSQSVYAGPARKHADQAYEKLDVLGRHGLLVNCHITFFDGFRIRQENTKYFPPQSDPRLLVNIFSEDTQEETISDDDIL